MKVIHFCLLLFFCQINQIYSQIDSTLIVEDRILADTLRNRIIPITEYKTDNYSNNKPIVIINLGYGEETTAYSFIAKKFVSECYLVISIGHELPTDEPLAREGNLYKLRLPVWERGVKNIQFVLKETNNIEKRIILIGHSNGGDISMLYAKEFPEKIDAAITLDHRRVPIPRKENLRILSIRADEFNSDEGVIPKEEELKKYPIKIVKLLMYNIMI
ncbi:MAG: alpha/beta fold hydrolase [Ignavibacteriales bacterium]|nr:alpha/beta fold hydrolase [Ignavibacteriales bacterium]